ncbi:MAG: Gfo/Idh/MocA family oxidoreductase [Chloroflexota bacterium]
MSKKVVIIGHTGRGNYGHYLDGTFVGVDGAEIVALADPDEVGRQQAVERTGGKKGYADYRDMLSTEKPDITVIATREIGDHFEIAMAAAEADTHIYIEKPIAASPAEVDKMVAACDQRDKLLIVGCPWRGHPPIQNVAIPLIKSGKIGEPRLARIHGMNGHEGGNQLFLDLYPHFFDFLWQVWGAPTWCHAHITRDGHDVTPADLFQGAEGMGLVAGNGIRAYYVFENGFAADFESYEGDHDKERPYRIDIHGTEGTLSLPGPMSNQPDIYYHPLVSPRLFNDDRWEVIPSDPPPDDHKWANAHKRLARCMLDVLDGKEPEFELLDGRTARMHLEWAMAAHASHIAGARVTFPLPSADNPFDSWQ